ncbi:hypothetical protein, partial [Hoeflea sp.]|uniref:hypothetical protein n=1 Tax=Hoeflea sp. TaxID=1940281 RepID=UPI0025BD0778
STSKEKGIADALKQHFIKHPLSEVSVQLSSSGGSALSRPLQGANLASLPASTSAALPPPYRDILYPLNDEGGVSK